MADMVLIVTYFSFLLGFGVLVANMMKKVQIPDTFLLLLVGLFCGPTIWRNPAVAQYIDFIIVDVDAMSVVPDFLRILALALIVFVGAFNLDFKELKKFSDISVNIAFVVVLLNIIVIGVAAKLIFGFGWLAAFLVAAIVSGTDASVVFTFESTLKKQGKVLTVLKLESILNSPLSVLIPILILDLLAQAPGTNVAPTIYISQFWQMIVAGIGSGVVIGLAITKVINKMLKEYSALIIFSIALLTFGLAESVGGSGMLAVAVSGFIVGNLGFPHKDRVREFQNELSDMLRISVFTLLGAQIFLDLNPYLLLVEFLFALFVFVIRPIFITHLARDFKDKVGYEGFTLLKLMGPRGISAAAMAPIAAVALGDQLIMNLVFMVIFFSVLLSSITAKLVSSGKATAMKDRYDGAKAMIRGKGRGEDLEDLEEEPVEPTPEETEEVAKEEKEESTEE